MKSYGFISSVILSALFTFFTFDPAAGRDMNSAKPQAILPSGEAFNVAAGGPSPVYYMPPAAQVMAARIKMNSLRPGEKLTSRDCHIILQYAVQNIRTTIFKGSYDMLAGKISMDKFFTPDVIAGFCELAEAASFFILDDLGIDRKFVFRGQAARLFGPNGCRHAFVITLMPDGKYYLIDPTFRQFFHQKQTSPKEIGYAGILLLKEPMGAVFAETLLKRGYIEFNDEFANIYGRALSRYTGDIPPSYTLSYIVSNNEGPYGVNRMIFSAGNIPVIPPLPARGRIDILETRQKMFSEKILQKKQ